jgi:peptidoglycan/xylan/chitin deacetylase (PgdA/CDA1 family)
MLIWPRKKGLRVLMYHHIHPTNSDGLTIPLTLFQEQLAWLKKTHYQVITPRQFFDAVNGLTPWPENPVLLTFDDAYTDFETYALPVLEQANLGSLVFVPTGFVGKSNTWDEGKSAILDVTAIRNLGKADWGFHSHEHLNYHLASHDQVHADISQMCQWAQENDMTMFPGFAYPYGQYPRGKKERASVNRMLYQKGIQTAFRIGNRVNAIPLKDSMLIQRIDIRGDEPFQKFKFKIHYGKWT